MFCRQCGTQVNDDDKFCVNCGFKLKGESDVKQDVLAEVEKDFSQLNKRLENINSINSHDHYFKNKWITLILYLLPAFGWLGIYNIYANRKKGGIQIGLWVLNIIFVTLIPPENTLVNIAVQLIIFSIFVLWISDLIWVFKLPTKYYIKGKKIYSPYISEKVFKSDEVTNFFEDRNIIENNTYTNSLVKYDNRKYINQIPKEIVELLWIKDDINYNDNNPSLEIEPSLIDLSLEILETDNINDNQEIGYYPCYYELTPKQRFIYLNWLKDITKPINISYVFIFYYGLERHLLFGEFEKAFNVINILRKYHFNSSFLSYSEDAILISIIKRDKFEYTQKISFSNSNPLLFALVISKAFKRFNAEDLILLSRNVGFYNQRYIKGDRKKFINELNRLLKEKYGEEYYNIKDEDIENYTETFTLAFANYSLEDIYRFEEAPDILSNETIREDIYELLEETHERVKILKREERKIKKS